MITNHHKFVICICLQKWECSNVHCYSCCIALALVMSTCASLSSLSTLSHSQLFCKLYDASGWISSTGMFVSDYIVPKSSNAWTPFHTLGPSSIVFTGLSNEEGRQGCERNCLHLWLPAATILHTTHPCPN